jgi:hypothetical protein
VEWPLRWNRKGHSSPNRHTVCRAKEIDMSHRTGPPSDAWARLAAEIITTTSWRPLLRATVLVLACALAAVATALVIFVIR